MAADVQRGVRHAHYRRRPAAIRADRAQLEPLQAVHAAVAPRQVRRPQPRLVAGGADGAQVDVWLAHERLSLAMKKPSVRSRCGSVCRAYGMVGCFQAGCAIPRSSATKSPRMARNASTTRSFSMGEIVQVA